MWNNSVTLAGHLTSKPETKTVKTADDEEKTVCNFSIGVNSGHDESSFFRCAAWGKQAEYIAKYGEKGQMIMLEGELRSRSYMKDDVKVTAYEVQVRDCHLVKKSESAE